MASIQNDPTIMQDFLTESGELLEQLDRDLVLLEETPQDLELLNRIFRALHTIKGSASFLALTNLVNLAHAAEGALNAARNRVFEVNRGVMDLLLQAVDILKKHFVELQDGSELTIAPAALVADLTALGEGKRLPTRAGAASGSTPEPASAAGSLAADPTPRTLTDVATAGYTKRALQLSPSKADLLSYLLSDLEQTLNQVTEQFVALGNSGTRSEACTQIAEFADAIRRSADFFEFPAMRSGADVLTRISAAACDLPDLLSPSIVLLGERAVSLMREQSSGLESGFVIARSTQDLDAACNTIFTLQQPIEPFAPLSTPTPESNPDHPAEHVHAEPADAAADPKPENAAGPAANKAAAVVEQTIRVEVGRLEALLNLVGELVLQKNRLGAISRKVVALQDHNEGSMDLDLTESLTRSTGGLDRLTSDIQVAVMRTRMQPLEKLFGKYPRLIRDLARKTEKQIRLVVDGGDTEVDKSVIEELADPLVHIMRNSADHGIEMPADRLNAGKPECGTIHINASHEGSHVLICISDDGRGLARDKIGGKAVKQGLLTQAELDGMSDREVQSLIFAPGFSTAEVVSDLSGRGVGMDVVRTNIEKIKGTIELDSEPGKGTKISIKIPLTVAIMTAMMVGIGSEIYAVPLHNILEIVRPESSALSTINGVPVMRLRDSVLPLMDGNDVFGLPSTKRQPAPFAVVLAQGERRVGMMVTRLIGQQQIVIKPLDGMADRSGAVSGATVRDDGGVSLIVDVGRMIALAQIASNAVRTEPKAVPSTASPISARASSTSTASC